jgi:PAS domain S-box-containing protein
MNQAALQQALLVASMDAVIAADGDRRIVVFNPAAERMFGCAAADALGTSIDRYLRVPAHVASMGQSAALEIVARRATGEEFPAEASGCSAGSGAEQRYVLVLRDVSQRHAAERRARELTDTLAARVNHRTDALLATIAELESFSYTIAHDLRAPLRAIDGYAQMVAEDDGPALGEEGQRRLQEVRENAARMSRLIDGLLAFSRLSRVEPVLEPVCLRGLALDVVAQMQACGALGAAGVHVGALPTVSADPALMRQVFEHLIGNAAKFSAKVGQPRIEVGCASGPEVTVYVRDNGAGFDMRYAGKLFGVFQRLHHPADFDGTGVGLAITRRILERHGRRIWAEGAPGRGACFTFTAAADAGTVTAQVRDGPQTRRGEVP